MRNSYTLPLKIHYRHEYVSRLRTFRWQQRLTQANLAATLGVARQTLSEIEQCKREPSLRIAYLCAEYFKVPIEKIFVYRKHKM